MNFLELFNKHGLIAAHRGARAICPENTMSALKSSIGHCDFIEIDVQLSRDGVAIIMHDETLERTTNVAKIDAYKNRIPYRVCDFTFKELSSLDYGSWFYKDDGYTHSEPLLSLHDALHFIKKHQLFLNIEIKDMHKYFDDEYVVSTILKEIDDLQIQNLILLSSFRHEYLSLCKKKMLNIPTAVLVKNRHPSSLIEYLNTLQADAYHLNDELVDKATVAKLQEAGFFVNVYTVNDLIRREQLFNMGVNGVFSDFLE
ncbi:MAG: glycerophosphodiester phosphodiesterase [Arcobacteraceae bacterium]|nr:glycerophosphodiester phosphodiesterase [Arcobacteraceae bacterium]